MHRRWKVDDIEVEVRACVNAACATARRSMEIIWSKGAKEIESMKNPLPKLGWPSGRAS